MIENAERQLSLDRLAVYQIEVPGHLDESWSECVEGLSLAVESDPAGRSITTLTGEFDQAALQGLLRRLYARGLPLISARCLD